MKANELIQFELSISGRSDGTLEAMYIRLRDGKVARTVEAQEDVLLVDYDRRGNLLGIEVLAPVRLSSIVRHVDRSVRAPLRRFVRHSAPPELISA